MAAHVGPIQKAGQGQKKVIRVVRPQKADVHEGALEGGVQQVPFLARDAAGQGPVVVEAGRAGQGQPAFVHQEQHGLCQVEGRGVGRGPQRFHCS